MQDAVFREASDLPPASPVELPLSGRVVCAVAVSRFVPFLRLHFWEGAGVPNSTPGPEYTLLIEGPLRITSAEHDWSIDPQAGPDAAYLRLVTKTVARAIASADGGLVVEFTDGDRLIVPPDKYEPWQLDGEDQSLVVSVAGGGLAIWEGRRNT